MMSSRTSVMGRFPGSCGRGRLRPPRPAEHAGGDEDSTEDEVGRPDPGRDVNVDQPEQTDGDDREGGEDKEGAEQPEHYGPGDVLSGDDRLVADGRDNPLDVVDRVGRPVAHGSSFRPRTRRAYPPVAGRLRPGRRPRRPCRSSWRAARAWSGRPSPGGPARAQAGPDGYRSRTRRVRGSQRGLARDSGAAWPVTTAPRRAVSGRGSGAR